MPKCISIVDIIHAHYYQLSAAERKVADHVLSHLEEIQYQSINHIAEECSVADATVSRFCRSLGLKGFHDFKLEIARHLASSLAARDRRRKIQYTNQNPVQKVGQASLDAIEQTLALLKPQDITSAVIQIEKSRKILCMGSGASMIIAKECAHLFSTVCNKFFAVEDSHLQVSAAATLQPQDLIVLFSYSGETKNGIALLEIAKARNVPSILITRQPKSHAAQLADIVLCCGSIESPFQFGSVPARVAQLVLLDILFNEYISRNQEQCDQSLNRIGTALANMHV